MPRTHSLINEKPLGWKVNMRPRLEQTHYPALLIYFRTFYTELLRLRAQVLRSRNLNLKRASGYTEDSVFMDVHETSETLANFLREQAIMAKKEWGHTAEQIYQEAQYIMASFADETFLALPGWPGRRFWQNNLIEQKLFKTHIGGKSLFARLEDFLARTDKTHKDLGFLYLTVLGLGFRGQYRGFDDKNYIQHCKERLFAYLYEEKSHDLFEDMHLFPQTYSATISRPLASPLMQEMQKWSWLFLSAVVGYIVLAYGVWFGATHILNSSSHAILADLELATSVA